MSNALLPFSRFCDWLPFAPLAIDCLLEHRNGRRDCLLRDWLTVREGRCGVGGIVLAAWRGLIRLPLRDPTWSSRCTLSIGRRRHVLFIRKLTVEVNWLL